MLRRSYWRSQRGHDPIDGGATFEEAYLRYEFAELVRLAMVAGAWVARVGRGLERRRVQVSRKPPPAHMTPAE